MFLRVAISYHSVNLSYQYEVKQECDLLEQSLPKMLTFVVAVSGSQEIHRNLRNSRIHCPTQRNPPKDAICLLDTCTKRHRNSYAQNIVPHR